MISHFLGRLIFKLAGWSFDSLPDYWTQRQLLICFPHTSNLDTFLAFAYFGFVEGTPRIMIKREAFFWPLSSLLNFLGAIPVRRDAAQGIVEQMVEQLSQEEEFSLCIMPEGTRKGARRIRTGFWHIARGLELPITCCYLDHKSQHVCWIGQVQTSDDLDKDLEKIAALYKAQGYLIPDRRKGEVHPLSQTEAVEHRQGS